MAQTALSGIKILTKSSKPLRGCKKQQAAVKFKIKRHIQGRFSPDMCFFQKIFMNKKWKRTTVLGGLAVIVMVILRRRKKQLKLSENNIKIVREKKKKRQ